MQIPLDDAILKLEKLYDGTIDQPGPGIRVADVSQSQRSHGRHWPQLYAVAGNHHEASTAATSA